MKGLVRTSSWMALLIGSAIFCSLLSQHRLQPILASRNSQTPEYGSLQTEDPMLLRLLLSGYEGFAASIIWTQSVLQFSDQVLSGRFQQGLGRNLEAVIALDTLWKYPHEFAGMVLESPGRKPHPDGVRLLADGVRRFPEDARLSILLSQLILQAPWMDSIARLDSAIAVLLPLANGKIHAPEYARTLAVSLTAKAEGGMSALRQLLYLWGSESDPLVRYTFSSKLPDLVTSATGLRADSLDVVCDGVRRIMEAREDGAASVLSEMMQSMSSPQGRSRTYRVFAAIGAGRD